MIEEIKSLLDWVAGKEMWYWFTIAIAFGVASNILKGLFGPVWKSIKTKRPRRSKKTKQVPEGKWAKYQ